MLTFRYSAVDQEGDRQAGTLSAGSEAAAVNILRERNLIVTGIEVKKELNLPLFFLQLRGVPLEEKAIFTRQFATMISSGLQVTQALQILEKQSRHQILKKAISDIIIEIDSGSSLSMAFSKHPEVFDRLYLALIRAGEASGNLDQILARLADSLAQDATFKKEIQGALIYPALIFTAMGGVLVIMLTFVIPRLSNLYQQLNVELPITTRILIFVSSSLVSYWWLTLLLLALAVLGYRYFSRTLRGRYLIDELKQKTPVFGKLNKQVQLAAFARTLSILTGSGLPILEALDIASESLSNIKLREGMALASQMVERGKALAEPLRSNPEFPPILAEMVAVGEQTGKVDEVLRKVAEFFEGEAGSTTKNLTTALEPFIMIILGVMVGFMVISMVMPIYTLTSKF